MLFKYIFELHNYLTSINLVSFSTRLIMINRIFGNTKQQPAEQQAVREFNNREDVDSDGEPWFRACEASELPNGGRIHIEVDGRYVTIFRNKNELSCIDARKC